MSRLGSDYFCYLLDLIEVLNGKYEDYLLLTRHLFSIDYIPIFDLDRNRAEGGLNIRRDYANDLDLDVDYVKSGKCTVLEMLIGLSITMSNQYEEPVSRWFWEMIGNLDLLQFTDDNWDSTIVNLRLSTWLDHKYSKTGKGSIFPLCHPKGDCRNMLVWDMMNMYLHENYPITNIN